MVKIRLFSDFSKVASRGQFIMKSKRILSEYFKFSQKDRLGILALVLLILLVFFLPEMINRVRPYSTLPPDTAWLAQMHQLLSGDSSNNAPNFGDKFPKKTFSLDPSTPAVTLFPFDPNTLPVSGWQRLGLRPKTIETIERYRSKGGRFRSGEDLRKIYGLREDEFHRLLPYVRLEESRKPELNQEIPKPVVDKTKYVRYSSTPAIIDINTADTSAFIRLPGIGSKLAARIVLFREKLGGFYRIEQVGETFGLQDSVFRKIKPFLELKEGIAKKININSATVEELRVHPYLRHSIANAIVAYRKEHGEFKNLIDLKQVLLITDEIYSKISPYLTL